MAKVNMVKVSTLIRKGYLLAGVVMAANMFVVNEVKATTTNDSNEKNVMQDVTENKKKKDEKGKLSGLQSFFNFLLYHENAINLTGGTVSSVANNYLKLWDYNPGGYLKLRIGCLGWRTKKFFDIVQLDFNLNLWRGIGWLIPHIFSLFMLKKKHEKLNISWGSVFIKDILRGFISAPLTIHISNFSISISLDSILWEFVIGRFLFKDEQKNIKEEGEKNDKPDDSTIKESDTTSQNNNGQTGEDISGQGAAN